MNARTVATVSLYDTDLVETRTIPGDLIALHLGNGREGSIYGTPRVMRKVRDRLSVALGDNGAARIAGIRDGAVVWVDDNGQHAVLLDELAELDDCAHCDLPATTSNDLDQPTCVGHA